MANINHLITKVTSNCDLACNYCQYSSRLTDKNKYINMSSDVLQRTVFQFMSLQPVRCTFVWHGGEPLLVGREFYEEAIAFQKQYKKEGQRVVNAIQTNGTLLNQEWINFFRQNGFYIDISLDGPPEIHDAHRLYPSGKGSFSDVMQAVELLKANKLKFGLLATVTGGCADKAAETYNFLKSHSKIFDFQPVEINTDIGEMIKASITPSEFAEFAIQVFDLWMEDDDPDIRLRYFEDILIGLFEGRPVLCQVAGTCSNLITIDCNGDLYPCDNFMGYDEFRFGNILHHDFRNILESDKYKYFVEAVNTIKPECSECEWYQICHGGCSYHRYMFGRNFFNRNYFCEANKRIFKHIEDRVREIIQEGRNIRKPQFRV